jgi:hypothetical protein
MRESAANSVPTVGSCRNGAFQPRFRVPPDDLKANLAGFVSFAQTLKGDEKSEAQSFLDQFFRALGHKSAIEAGATFEFRVAKKPGSAQLELVVAGNGDPGPALRSKGGKKFAELADVGLRALWRETMRKLNYSLRDLYRTLDQPGDNPLRDAHARLDAAVRAAYDMAEDADPLTFLLELNLACAAKERAGEKITPPGLPLPVREHADFVTDDCIQSPKI